MQGKAHTNQSDAGVALGGGGDSDVGTADAHGHTQRYQFSHCLDPLRNSNSRRRSAMPSFLGFVFATRWSSPSLHLGHPLWWPATTFATAACEAFQNDDAFLDLLSLTAKLGQHLVDVHLRSLPALVGSVSSRILRRWRPPTPISPMLEYYSLNRLAAGHLDRMVELGQEIGATKATKARIDKDHSSMYSHIP